MLLTCLPIVIEFVQSPVKAASPIVVQLTDKETGEELSNATAPVFTAPTPSATTTSFTPLILYIGVYEERLSYSSVFPVPLISSLPLQYNVHFSVPAAFIVPCSTATRPSSSLILLRMVFCVSLMFCISSTSADKSSKHLFSFTPYTDTISPLYHPLDSAISRRSCNSFSFISRACGSFAQFSES